MEIFTFEIVVHWFCFKELMKIEINEKSLENAISKVFFENPNSRILSVSIKKTPAN
jgi:hypothetical protein